MRQVAAPFVVPLGPAVKMVVHKPACLLKLVAMSLAVVAGLPPGCSMLLSSHRDRAVEVQWTVA